MHFTRDQIMICCTTALNDVPLNWVSKRLRKKYRRTLRRSEIVGLKHIPILDRLKNELRVYRFPQENTNTVSLYKCL